MSAADDEATVRRGIEAWNAKDWDTIEAMTHPEGTLIAPHGWPEAGTFKGWPDIHRQYEQIKAPWRDERIELVGVEHVGERLLASARWITHGESSGVPLEHELWIAYRFRDGLIDEVMYSLDEAPARRAVEG